MNIEKYLWYIPLSIVFVVNMVFLGSIWVMDKFGKGLVFINNAISDLGDIILEKSGHKPKYTSKDDIEELKKMMGVKK